MPSVCLKTTQKWAVDNPVIWANAVGDFLIEMCGDVVVDAASHTRRQSAASVLYCDLHLAIASERNWEINRTSNFHVGIGPIRPALAALSSASSGVRRRRSRRLF